MRERVGELFGTVPLVDMDPDRVVAVGAALQADVLAGNKSADEMLPHLEAAVAHYENLGFTIKPGTLHENGLKMLTLNLRIEVP